MQSLREFEPLLPAERRLVDQAATGARVEIGEGALPTPDAEDVEIRAGLIRLILLGLDPTAIPHAKGIRVRGARITGTLDFQGVDCANDLSLSHCVMDKTLVFVNARMRGVFLSGCVCPGISADNAVFDGSVYLRNGFVSTGEIALPGARISGDLQICDAKLMARAARRCVPTRCGSVDPSIWGITRLIRTTLNCGRMGRLSCPTAT